MEVTQNLSVSVAAGPRRRIAAAPLAAAAAIVAAMVVPNTASGVSNPVSGGSTSLVLTKRFKKRLDRKDAKLKGISPTGRSGRTLSLRISSGSLNAVSGSATLQHGGGLKLRANGHRIRLRDPELRIGPNTGLTVTVGSQDRKVKLLRLQGGTRTAAGFGFGVSGLTGIVTGRGAKIVNRALRGRIVRARKKAGTLSTSPNLKQVAVGGGQVTLAVAPPFLARLNVGPQPLFGPMAADPIAPATIIAASPPTFSFPILSGSVAPDLTTGQVITLGGIRFSRPPYPAITPPPPPESPASYPTRNQAEVTDLLFTLNGSTVDGTATVRPFTQPPMTRTTVAATIDFSGASSSIDPATRTITISNVAVSLGSAALTLNAFFSNPTLFPPPAQPTQFAIGDQLGTATLTTTIK
jgi:hypothetical protein